AAEQTGDSGGLGTLEALVLAVDVVHDLSDRAHCGVPDGKPADQRLEGAGVADVRVVTLGHVELELAGPWSEAARGHEPELRLGIDEPPDQPGAGDTIDEYAFARDPGGTRLDPIGPVGRWTRRRRRLTIGDTGSDFLFADALD